MRTVFSNKQCVHVWAQQTQEHGRSHSLSFRGPVLYSYATPIANFIEHKGKRACLITSRTYSPTTSKNMPRDYDIPNAATFRVHHIGTIGGRAPYDFGKANAEMHKVNLRIMAEEYEVNLRALSRARNSDGINWRLDDLGRQRKRAFEYAKFFGARGNLNKKFPIPSDDTIKAARVRGIADSLKKASATKEEKAHRAQTVAACLDLYLKNERDLPWDWKHSATPEQRNIAEQHAPMFEAKRIESWRAGNDVQLSGLGSDVLLRIKGDNIQTSRGAEFPVKHGKKAITFIRRARKLKRVWETNGHKIPLGVFQIDRIESDGTVKAGCHVVKWTEVKLIADQLNI